MSLTSKMATGMVVGLAYASAALGGTNALAYAHSNTKTSPQIVDARSIDRIGLADLDKKVTQSVIELSQKYRSSPAYTPATSSLAVADIPTNQTDLRDLLGGMYQVGITNISRPELDYVYRNLLKQ